MTTNQGRGTLTGLLLVFLGGPLLVGCLVSNEGRPDTARLELTGAGASSMELVMSTDFLVVNGDLSFQDSDTSTVTLPFGETYPLGAPARIYLRARNVQDQALAFTMRVWIDGESWYDESRDLEAGEDFEFLYRYAEPGIR
jgi:hypothetical protein